jgi:hypothetical protein
MNSLPRRSVQVLLAASALALALGLSAADAVDAGRPAGAHWAFEKPARAALPAAGLSGWARSPIDAFILAALEARGLAPAAPAGKAALLRRLHFDLLGLPPARDEIAAFLADEREDALERAADRLLASPQYGERWARHWMDIWRYSDWYGRRAVPDVMSSYPQIWRWRDWIVRSLNEDRGYDAMVLDMLAADELAPADPERVVATGFLVRNWYKWNYNQWMKDNVEHAGKAFLALTLNCAHCHDHKYDPITQEDYFRFRAFFEPLELRHDRVPGLPDPGPFRKYVYAESYGPIASGAIRVFDEKLDAATFMYADGDERKRIPDRAPVPPGVPASFGAELRIAPIELPPEAWYPGLQRFVQDEERASCRVARDQAAAALTRAEDERRRRREQGESDAKLLAACDRAVGAAAGKLAAAEAEIGSLEARIAADRARFLERRPDADALAAAASEAERRARAAAAEAALREAESALAQAEARPESEKDRAKAIEDSRRRIAAAADALEKARTAPAAGAATTYAPLGPVYPRESTGRRAALARWIASPENPLAARVAANHIWSWHFGAPIVESASDFGHNGKRPTHPELLDRLAIDLAEGGWSMKRLHRKLVGSAAYRQSARLADADPRGPSVDPVNRLVWRFRSRRLEAEAVRDALLHAAGELDLTIGGPELEQSLGAGTRRRSLYYSVHGEGAMALLEIFDGPNVRDCYRRGASVAPQQALALANSEFALGMGRRLARRLWQETGGDEAGFIRAAFEAALGRAPSAEEAALTAAFLDEQAAMLAAAVEAELAAAALAEGEVAPSADPRERTREDAVHALLNHNDFVTVR